MKRKSLRTGLIVLGVIILILILLAVGGPLLESFGINPICLQGELPRIKVVPCPQAVSTVTPMPSPSLGGQAPIPLIFDDDGSPDGTIALLYFLTNPRFDVQTVTISPGEAHPALFAERMQMFLAGIGREDIPVGAGREIPLEGNNAFPNPWRQASDDFWGLTPGSVVVTPPPAPAARLIVDTINRSGQPVILFVSGTHTNLAEALRLDPGISTNIRDVFIMGGNVYVPGNINTDWPENENKVAEWNIWVDPVAADEVFASGLPLHLVPLDATRQVMWTREDLTSWEKTSTQEGSKAHELLGWMLDSWSPDGVYIWDLVAAVQASNPNLCQEVNLGVDIQTAPGPEQGRMLIDETQNDTTVCLNPDADQVKSITASAFTDR